MSTSHKDPDDIHCGLGVRVSDGGGFYSALKTWLFLSARFNDTISSSANGKAQHSCR